MIAALSPYLLTARSHAAMAALLLADEVRTVMPSPDGAPSYAAVGEAAARVRPFLGLMEAWSWSMPLWNAGVIGTGPEHEAAVEDIRHVLRMIAHDERYASLHPLMHSVLERSDDGYLRAFSADLLKAGADPAISLPVTAGLDRFAGERGYTAVRGEPASMVERAEQELIRVAVRFAVPIVMRGSGQRLVVAREELAPWLDALRESMDELDAEAVRSAASEYASAFDSRRDELCRCTDPDEPRTVAGTVVVTLGEMPADAALRASLSATRDWLGGNAARSQSEADTSCVLLRTLGIRAMGSSAGAPGRR
ncbi:MAG: hypothetical protein ACTS22_05560 [Phycisphaerales bacterium]